MKILRTSGVNKNLKKNKILKNGLWFYEQQMLFNYRMNDISASLGISQMNKLNFFVKRRNQIVKRYIKNLNNNEVKFQVIKKGYVSSYHLFIIRVDKNIRKRLFNKLRKEGYLQIFTISQYIYTPTIKNLVLKKECFLIQKNIMKSNFSPHLS